MSIMEPPPRDNRQRKHSTKTIQLARRMYGNGDSWTPTQIRDYLAAQGIPVSLNTVRLWVIPGMADEHRAQNRSGYHRRRSTATTNLDRIRRLEQAGLSSSAIGIVMGVYHDLPLTENQVRYSLRAGREPKAKRRG